jgi:hypothetical protein
MSNKTLKDESNGIQYLTWKMITYIPDQTFLYIYIYIKMNQCESPKSKPVREAV